MFKPGDKVICLRERIFPYAAYPRLAIDQIYTLREVAVSARYCTLMEYPANQGFDLTRFQPARPEDL